MSRPKAALVLLPALALAIGARAQEPNFDELDARLRFELDESGQVLLWPDPASSLPEFGPLVELYLDWTSRESAGLARGLAALIPGDTDLASMADGATLLTRLGRADEPSLLQAIGQCIDGSHHQRLLGLLAIRVAQDRGLETAIGVLERIAASDQAATLTRAAAREAVASLRGAKTPHLHVKLGPLAEFLAGVPADVDLIVRVDDHRLPPGRPILRWGTIASTAYIKGDLRHVGGGPVSLEEWAGAIKASEGTGALPYELARRFGNHRIARHVFAIRMPHEGEADPRVWAHADGVFDVARLRDGLREAGIEARGDADRLNCAFEAFDLVVTPGSAQLRSAEVDDNGMGGDAAVELAKEIEVDDAPLVAYLRQGVRLPGALASLRPTSVPRRIALWLPRGNGGSVELRTTWASAAVARAISTQIESLPRMLGLVLSKADDDHAFGTLPDALDTLEVECHGAECTATVSMKGLDLDRLVRSAIAHIYY